MAVKTDREISLHSVIFGLPAGWYLSVRNRRENRVSLKCKQVIWWYCVLCEPPPKNVQKVTESHIRSSSYARILAACQIVQKDGSLYLQNYAGAQSRNSGIRTSDHVLIAWYWRCPWKDHCMISACFWIRVLDCCLLIVKENDNIVKTDPCMWTINWLCGVGQLWLFLCGKHCSKICWCRMISFILHFCGIVLYLAAHFAKVIKKFEK